MKSSEFWAGVRAELPIQVGVVPFGLIYGVLAVDAGMPPGAAQAMSAVVFAGSAQFLVTQLYHISTPALVMVMTIGVVNLRHMLYSASLAPHLQRLSSAWKLLLAYLLTDEAYAVTIVHYERTESSEDNLADDKHWFFLGAGLTLWLFWQLSTAVGIILGAVVPESWSLDFALALTFIALLTPMVKDRAGLAAALTAGIVALLTYSLPYKLGLMAAAVFGILAGLVVERRR